MAKDYISSDEESNYSDGEGKASTKKKVKLTRKITKKKGSEKAKKSAKAKSTALRSKSKVTRKAKKAKKTAAGAKTGKKKFYLPGQKHDTPKQSDGSRIFYESWYVQVPGNPTSEKWLLEHGLLPIELAKKLSRKK